MMIRTILILDSLFSSVAIEDGPFAPTHFVIGFAKEKTRSEWTDDNSYLVPYVMMSFLISLTVRLPKKCGILCKIFMKDQLKLKW